MGTTTSSPGRKSATPTVVFADHARWGAFTQLAAVVRRAGWRTVRVTTTRRTGYSRAIDRLLYDRSIYLDDPARLADLGELLVGEDVVDVQCTEYTCALLSAAADPRLPDRPAQSLQLRRLLLDKFVVGQMAEEHGVRVPEKIAADLVMPAEAVKQLGLPVVVKARVGASGDKVRIATTVEEAEQAIHDFGPDLTDLFYERFIEGDLVDYSAVVGPAGVIQELATRTVLSKPDETTPPRRIELIDDLALLAFGQAAVRAFGVTGLAHLDTVRDEDGRYWLLDLNLRAWGSMLPAEAGGVDLGAGYLHAVGLRPEPPTRRTPDAGVVVDVFPGLLDDSIAQRRAFRALAQFARHSPRYLRRLGARYWLTEFLVLGVGLAGAWRDHLRH